jgi:hypothetical protein
MKASATLAPHAVAKAVKLTSTMLGKRVACLEFGGSQSQIGAR